MWTLFFLLSLILVAYTWYTHTQIREEAYVLARATVLNHGYQLLDDAIGLSRIQFQKQGRYFILLRAFEFHYVDENNNRRMAEVIRCGRGWLNVVFDDHKVISFPEIYHHV